MQFMMFMFPNAYRGNKPDAGAALDLKELEPMGRFNDEFGKAVKILGVNGLRSLHLGGVLTLAKGSPR